MKDDIILLPPEDENVSGSKDIPFTGECFYFCMIIYIQFLKYNQFSYFKLILSLYRFA